MTRLLLTITLLLTAATAAAQAPFITVWQSDNPGASEDNQITIPANAGEVYNYDVYWEDVSDETVNGTETGVTGTLTLTFPAPGTYRVEITGTFPRIDFSAFTGDAGKILTVEQWGDIAWSSMELAFWTAVNLDGTAVDAPDLSAANNTASMFDSALSFNGDIGDWDVSTVVNMIEMFEDAGAFNQDIGGWDVSNVTQMTSMFSGATSFNQNIGGWDVSSVTVMDGVFNGATSFNQDIGGWNVSGATRMPGMFSGATSFNQDIGGWDVSSVTEMSSLFSGASAFNQDISGWDISNVTSMGGVFQDASAFNQNISSWNTSNVTNMRRMFDGASAFNQDISAWDVSNVTGFPSMSQMFSGASAFDQNLGGWDVSNVTNMVEMLDDSGLSTENYDSTLIGWAAQDVQSGVELGAQGLTFCDGADARQSLIDDHGWIITGDLLDCGEVPENDTLANAIVLTESGTYEGSNVGATLEDGEPEPSCTFQDWTTNFSVWWSFTATDDGFVSINTFDSTFDTILSLHDASDLSEVACNDDSGGVLQSQIQEVSVVEGETYLIRVAGYNESEANQGAIQLTTDFQFGIADDASPEEIAEGLSLPTPNPVNGAATLTLAVENGQNVSVEVFDATGRRVQTLYDGALAAGTSETLTLDASALPAGVYVIRATGQDFSETRRVTVVR